MKHRLVKKLRAENKELRKKLFKNKKYINKLENLLHSLIKTMPASKTIDRK